MENKLETHQEEFEELVKKMLELMDPNPDRPGIKETPHRVWGYWHELLEGQFLTNEEIAAKFKKNFEVGYDPIVTMSIDNIFSNCEHHLALMYDGNAIVGYIPTQNKDGTFNVLGLSKIPRIVDMCARRLQLQEKLASDIAEVITLATGSTQVYVNLNMKHGCVSARGVKAQSFTNVTFMTKDLRRNEGARREFERKAQELRLINK